MLNWMAYVRGHSGDYDEWAALGNPGWAHEDVLPFFRKSQGAHGHGLAGEGADMEVHGSEGPLGVMAQVAIQQTFCWPEFWSKNLARVSN